MENNPDLLFRKISVYDDKQAFQLLFELYYAALCLYAKRYIDDRAAREDIVQDIFCALWEKRKFIDISTSAKNYLLTAVKNFSLNQLRKQGHSDDYVNRMTLQTGYDEHPHNLYTLHELESLLDKALQQLPEPYRIAFVMNRLELKKTSEIAEVLGVSVRTVERYRDRAVQILQQELKDYLPLSFFLFLLN